MSGDLEFDQFRVFLEKSCGILLGNNKQYLVSSRLNKLMEQNELKSLGELVRQIQAQPHRGLREQVVDAMTTNETLWFRDAYPFEVLRSRVLPELLKAAPGQRLRIWSAACSSGQEPYSLSMTIDEYERSNPSQPKPSVGVYSSPSRAMSCMPTQMPRNGRALISTASTIAANAPEARNAAAQAGKAPSPGRTSRSAPAITSG